MFRISEVDKDDSELACLIGELDAFQSTLYPAESNHCLDFSTVSNEALRCIIVHDANGVAVGCGAVLLQNGGYCELKRVFIRPEYRGRRLGDRIIASLESLALESDCHQLRLETGIHQQPAIALYRKCGYEICDAFLPYIADPLSVFMCKILRKAH